MYCNLGARPKAFQKQYNVSLALTCMHDHMCSLSLNDIDQHSHLLVWKSMIQLLLYGAAQAWQFEVVLRYKPETKIGLFLH